MRKTSSALHESFGNWINLLQQTYSLNVFEPPDKAGLSAAEIIPGLRPPTKLPSFERIEQPHLSHNPIAAAPKQTLKHEYIWHKVGQNGHAFQTICMISASCPRSHKYDCGFRNTSCHRQSEYHVTLLPDGCYTVPSALLNGGIMPRQAFNGLSREISVPHARRRNSDALPAARNRE
jgi:hypothetical protein